MNYIKLCRGRMKNKQYFIAQAQKRPYTQLNSKIPPVLFIFIISLVVGVGEEKVEKVEKQISFSVCYKSSHDDYLLLLLISTDTLQLVSPRNT